MSFKKNPLLLAVNSAAVSLLFQSSLAQAQGEMVEADGDRTITAMETITGTLYGIRAGVATYGGTLTSNGTVEATGLVSDPSPGSDIQTETAIGVGVNIGMDIEDAPDIAGLYGEIVINNGPAVIDMDVRATDASYSYATGIYVGGDVHSQGLIELNGANVDVIASDDYAEATGIHIGDLEGSIALNSADLMVAATDATAAVAVGIHIEGDIANTGSLTIEREDGQFQSLEAYADGSVAAQATAVSVDDIHGEIVVGENLGVSAYASGYDNDYIQAVSAIALSGGDLTGVLHNQRDIEAWAENGAEAVAIGVALENVSGEIINEDFMYGWAYAWNENNDVLSGSQTGVALGIGLSINELSGSIVNTGYLDGTGSGGIDNHGIGAQIETITSTGSLDTSGIYAGAYWLGRGEAQGLVVGTLAGSVTNAPAQSGHDLSAYATGTNTGIATGVNLGEVTSTGTLSNEGLILAEAGVWGNTPEASYGVDSLGVMASATGLRIGGLNGQLINSGAIEAELDYVVEVTLPSATITGIDIESLGESGSLVNSEGASIHADAESNDSWRFRDSTVTDASFIGVDVEYVAGLIENEGGITAELVRGGLLNSYLAGVRLGNVTETGEVSFGETGLIEVDASPVSYLSTDTSVHNITADGVVVGELNSTLTNLGDIVVSAEANGEVVASGMSVGLIGEAGVLTNGIAGELGEGETNTLIEVDALGGSRATATGIEVNAIDGELLNTGEIMATATVDASTSGFNGDADADEAYALGFDIGDISEAGVVNNSGTVEVTATAAASTTGEDGAASAGSVSAWGIYAADVSGELLNSGELMVSASATAETTGEDDFADVEYAYAFGIEVSTLGESGVVDNSAAVAVSATVEATAVGEDAGASASYASAAGVYTGTINGELINSGALMVTASATASTEGEDADAEAYYAYAFGMNHGSIGESGSLNNSSAITATASAVSTATGEDGNALAYDPSAYGISASTIDGELVNSGELTVTASASATADGEDGNADAGYAYAYGVDVSDIEGTGVVNNSGAISVTASAEATATGEDGNADVSYVSAYGIDASTVNGELINSGSLTVTASATATAEGEDGSASVSDVSAYGVDTDDINGELINSGEVVVTATGSASAEGEDGYAEVNDVYAYGIAVGTVGEGGVLDNSASITVTASADAAATGEDGSVFMTYVSAAGIETSDVNGELVNSGALTVTASAMASAEGEDGNAEITETIDARGINLSTIGESGIVNNSGAITVTAEGSASTVGEDGDASVSYVYAYGVEASTVDGELINSGEIMVTATATATAEGEDGDTDVDEVYAYGVEASNINGTLNNSASITVTASADAAATGEDGDVFIRSVSAAGIETSDVNGELVNSGALTVTASAMASAEGEDGNAEITETIDARGINVSTIGESGIVNNSGAITVTAEASASTVGEDGDASVSYVYAYGVAASSVDGELINSGEIMVTATATATAEGEDGDTDVDEVYAYGVEASNINGTLNNSASITVTASADAAATGEDGDVFMTSVSAAGIETSDVNGELVNSGALTVTASAMASAEGEDGNAEITETIDARGINLSTIGESGIVNNSGAITVTAEGSASTVGEDGDASVSYVYAYGVEASSVDGELINSGEIMVTATATATAEGEDGDASASSLSAYGIEVDAVNGELINSGALAVTAGVMASAAGEFGDAYANEAYAYGIEASTVGYLSGEDVAASGQLVNSGDVTVAASVTASAAGEFGEAEAYDVRAYGIVVGEDGEDGAGDLALIDFSGSDLQIGEARTVDGVLINSGALTVTATAMASTTGEDGLADANRAYASALELEDIGRVAMSSLGEDSTLTVTGELSNTGAITVAAGTTASTTGIFADSNAYDASAYGIELDDISDLDLYAAGEDANVTITGTLDNSGALTVSASANGSASGNDSDAFANSVYAYGVELDDVIDLDVESIGEDAVISLEGGLTNSGSVTVSATATAVAAGARGNAESEYVEAWGLQLDHVGSIDLRSMGDGTSVTASAELVNTGAISVGASASASATGEAGSADAEFVDAYGIEFDDIGQIDVYEQTGAVLGENVTIALTTGVANSGDLTITASSTASSSGNDGRADAGSVDAYGIEFDDVLEVDVEELGDSGVATFEGAFTNAGDIVVMASAAATTIGDGADAEGDFAEAYGIELEDVGDVTVSDLGAASTLIVDAALQNEGAIVVTAAVVGATSGASSFASASDSDVYGIELNDLAELSLTGSDAVSLGEDGYIDLDAAVTNNGAINATASAVASATGEDSDATAASVNAFGLEIDGLATVNARGIGEDALVTVDSELVNTGALTVSATADASTLGEDGDALAENVNAYGVSGEDIGAVTITGLGEAGIVSVNASLTNTGAMTVNATAMASATGEFGDATSQDVYAYGFDLEEIANVSITSADETSTVTVTSDVSNVGEVMVAASAVASAEGEDGDASVSDVFAYGIDTASISEMGTVANSGSIMVAASADASAMGEDGDAFVSNVNAYGVDTDDIGGELINAGELMVTATAAASGVGEDGDAEIDTVSAYGIDASDIGTDGLLENSVGIIVAASAEATATGESGDASISSVNAFGILASDVLGELSNSGQLTVTAEAVVSSLGGEASVGNVNAQGIEASMIGEDAAIENSGEISVAAIADTSASSVNALGMTVEGVLGGELVNSGSLDVEAAGSDNVVAWGMGVDFLFGGLANAGSVEVSANSAEAQALAGGVVAGISFSGDFGEIGEDVGSGIENSGSIGVVAGGQEAEAFGVALAFGVGEDAGTLVSNMGTIEVLATADGDADAAGIFGEDVYGAIENSGEISVTATSATGAATATGVELMFGEDAEAIGLPVSQQEEINVASMHSDHSSITNSSDIVVIATGATLAEAAGIAVGEMLGDITNTGDIQVSASGSSAVAAGIGVGLLSGTLSNSGAITVSATSAGDSDNVSAGIYVGELDGEIINSGSVVGGDDVLSLAVMDGAGAIENTEGAELIGGFVVGVNNVRFENRGLIDIGRSQGTTAGVFDNSGSGVLALTARSSSDHGVFNFTNDLTDLNADGEAATLVVDATNFAGLTTSTVIEDVIVYSAGYDQTDTLYDVTVNETSYLMTFEEVKDANTLDLMAVIDHMNDRGITQTLNRHGWLTGKGAGDRLEDLIENPSIVNADLQSYLDSLINESNEMTVLQAAQDNTPLMSGAATLAVRDSMRLVDQSVRDRTSLSNGKAAASGVLSDGNIWVQPFVSFGEQDPNNGAAGYDFDASGLIVGGDAELSEGRTLGMAVAYQRVDIDAVDGPAQNADVTNLRLIGYATQMLQADTQVRGVIDYGSGDVESMRHLSYGGRMAFGDYNLETYHVGLGVDHQLMSENDLTAMISLGVDYSRVGMDDYREGGAGGLNQAVDSQDVRSLVASFAGQLDLKLDDYYNVTARAGFGYDQINDAASLESRFTGGGESFVTKGLEADPVMGNVGLGLEYRKDDLTFSINVDAEVRDGYKEQSASLRWIYEL